MRRWQLIALGGSLATLVALSACGGDDDDGSARASASVAGGSTVATSAPGTASATGSSPASNASTTPMPTIDASSPLLTMPINRYSVTLDEVGTQFRVNVPGTFDHDTETYARSKTFVSPEEGRTLLRQWQYLGGYETGY